MANILGGLGTVAGIVYGIILSQFLVFSLMIYKFELLKKMNGKALTLAFLNLRMFSKSTLRGRAGALDMKI